MDQQQCNSFDCTGSGTDSSCSKILAGRAFMTLACIISAISVVCFILTIIMGDNIRSIILMGGKGLAFVCFACGIIGVAVGISGTTNNLVGKGVELGAGSIIGIIALIINLIGAIGSIMVK